MSDLTNKILDAIDIMANDKVSAVQFDKTVRATIVESVDPSVGKYKVKYQNSTFFAYANDLKSYSKGSAVYVVIPSSNFESHPYIVGTVRKLGADFIDVLTDDDRMSLKGSNVLTSLGSISFCSYKSHDKNTRTRELLSEGIVTADSIGLDIYKEDSDYILVGADFQTKLPQAQRLGSGNYGLRLICQYYNDKYKDSIKTTPSASSPPDLLIDRVYELDINKMVGQPYNLFNPTSQRAIFEIDAKNLYAIKSITAFCENFPEKDTGEYLEYKGRIHVDPQSGKEYFVRDKDGQRVVIPSTKNRYYDTSKKMWYLYDPTTSTFVSQSDIFISDFRIEFYEALSEEELEGISLRVTQPLGSYFLVDTATGEVKPDKLRLHADLRIKGKKVNYNEQKVHFYWFDKDVRVAYGHPNYSSYSGVGWRCLNEATGLGGFNPDLQDKDILSSQCPALVNTFKCVAVFENDNEVVQVDAQTIIINRAKPENEFSIVSSVGTSFAFNIGQTTLTLKQKGLDPTGNYRYYWGSGVDGQEIIWDGNENSTYRLQDIKIENALHFVTYECTVYTQNGNKVGSASITLVNGEAIGEYKLVLKNGSRIFKYNENGVSPNSPSLDELDRITIEPIGFDIYNEKGQLIDFADDTQKTQMCEITWFWPGTKAPATTSDESMIVKSSLTPTARNIEIINPLTNKGNKYWVIQNSATLPYNIENTYDLDKIENTIELEVVYKNQVLRASTNFTFTKDGEQGTNGTEYIMRIVPTNNDFKRIVIRDKVLQGQKADGSFVNAGNTPFKIQIWNGGLSAYKEYAASVNSVTWSTIKADRNQSCGLTINENSGIISINGNLINNPQNTTIKACLQTTELSEDTNKYFATYCIDTIVNEDYYIDGGFKECTYQSDGKRSAFSKKPFILKQNDGTIVAGTIKWNTGWETAVDGNNAVIEPPALYLGENIDTYISCSLDGTVVAYRPISLHLNRHGLSAMNDWDGNSLKLNNQGSNYILAPQVGAGKREEDGSFTGITIGKEFTGTQEALGLFGYHQGGRSIWLDANTGKAVFGKTSDAQITINPTGSGTISAKGMTITLGSNPSIRYSNGNFEVDSNGHLTAKGGGSIAGWKITNDRLTSQNNAIYLDSDATEANDVIHTPGFQVRANGSFKAGNNFAVDVNGNLTANGGKIAGWNFNDTQLYHDSGKNRMFMNSNGSIGGGTGGTYHGGGYTDLKWTITNEGVGYFSDVFINNNTRGKDRANIISIGNKSGESGGGTFTVNNKGEMVASKADIDGTVKANAGNIGGWKIDSSGIYREGFRLANSGSLSLGSGFTVNSSEITKTNGSTGSGKLSGTLGSNSGSSILGNALGSGGSSWQDEKLVANLEVSKKSIPSSMSVTINGTKYSVSVDSSIDVYGISGWDNYRADWLGKKVKQ